METNYIQQAYHRNYMEFYILHYHAINDVLVKYNITLSSFNLFAILILNFDKKRQIFTVRKIKRLDCFAKTFNYNRALTELHKAGFLHASEIGTQKVYWISDKGHWLPVNIECQL